MVVTIDEIINRLIAARKQSGLSQLEVSKLLGEFSQTAISAVETGKVRLTVDMLLVLADIYQVTPLWTFAGIETLDLDGMQTRLSLSLVVTPQGVVLDNHSARTIHKK